MKEKLDIIIPFYSKDIEDVSVLVDFIHFLGDVYGNVILIYTGVEQHRTDRLSLEFINSKIKFYTLNENNFLKNYITSINSVYNEQEWGFPKGRRKMRESDIDCAIREFYEETRIPKDNLDIIADIIPFEEIFFGTNGIMYKHLYYIAKLNNPSVNIKIDMDCLEQVREIRAIKWYNYNDVISHIKIYNTERIELFKFANKKIMDYEKTLIDK